ncbi:hypothetical protein C0995_001181 [Termitomyces sp. Mi166|nr:hypothetical protein C0995_001181 [Termitomyces sp. Mi166\
MSSSTTAPTATQGQPSNRKKTSLPNAPVDDIELCEGDKVQAIVSEGAKKRGLTFWLILVALGSALCLVSIELTATSAAQPAITEALKADTFIWISSSYTLASTAVLPLSGGISEIFGRRPAILSALLLFALGSALCATAQNMSWLIASRSAYEKNSLYSIVIEPLLAIQGLGGGMILSVTNIIIGDLVPLQERGFVSGVLGLSWALSAAFGPLIGGALADAGQWRWTFLSPIVMLAVIYYMPTYYQACKGASPRQSGIDSFGLTMALGPASIVTGISVTKTGKYRIQAYLGWVVLIVGSAALTTIRENTILAHSIGLPSLISTGAGMIYSVGYFPVLAPLPISRNAHALAFFAFCRSFAGVWGITVGGTILQNELANHLPAQFIASLPQSSISIAYSAIPRIALLEEPLRTQVRAAFAEGLRVIWYVMIGVSGVGFLSSLLMANVPMQAKMDQKWSVGKKNEVGDAEGDAGTSTDGVN